MNVRSSMLRSTPRRFLGCPVPSFGSRTGRRAANRRGAGLRRLRGEDRWDRTSPGRAPRRIHRGRPPDVVARRPVDRLRILRRQRPRCLDPDRIRFGRAQHGDRRRQQPDLVARRVEDRVRRQRSGGLCDRLVGPGPERRTDRVRHRSPASDVGDVEILARGSGHVGRRSTTGWRSSAAPSRTGTSTSGRPTGSGCPDSTNDPAALDTQPTWTADGRSVVFLSDRGNRWDLYRVPAEARDQGRASHGPRPARGQPVAKPRRPFRRLRRRGRGHPKGSILILNLRGGGDGPALPRPARWRPRPRLVARRPVDRLRQPEARPLAASGAAGRSTEPPGGPRGVVPPAGSDRGRATRSRSASLLPLGVIAGLVSVSRYGLGASADASWS